MCAYYFNQRYQSKLTEESGITRKGTIKDKNVFTSIQEFKIRLKITVDEYNESIISKIYGIINLKSLEESEDR